jgi:hypothetical protein
MNAMIAVAAVVNIVDVGIAIVIAVIQEMEKVE